MLFRRGKKYLFDEKLRELNRDVVGHQVGLGLDSDEKRAATTGRDAFAREMLGLEGAGKGPLQLHDGLLDELPEAGLRVERVQVLQQLGDHLGVGVRLEHEALVFQEYLCLNHIKE